MAPTSAPPPQSDADSDTPKAPPTIADDKERIVVIDAAVDDDDNDERLCCFICCEPASANAPLYTGLCKCKTAVHAECMVRLLDVPTHLTRCAVCHSEYDIRTRTRRALRFKGPTGLILCSMYALSVCALSTLVVLLHLMSLTITRVTTLIVIGGFVCVLGMSVGMGVYAHCKHYDAEHTLCCCDMHRVARCRVLRLPDAHDVVRERERL